VGKVLFVCDDVAADPLSHKPSILNIWEVVRPPDGAAFPFVLGKVVVVAQMRGGLGDIAFSVRIARADEDEDLREVLITVRFPDRLTARLVVVRFVDVAFPAPGGYLIQLHCEGDFVDDQVIRVLPPRGGQ